GFDQLMQASCGWEVEQGGAGEPPMRLRCGVGEFFAGLSSLYVLLWGHYQRARTGEGRMVTASLRGAASLTMSEAVAREDGSVTPIAYLDATQTGLCGTTGCIVVVTAGSPWRRLRPKKRSVSTR